MQEITLLLAIAASIIVIALPPVWGLIIYIAALGWYPAYITVKLGTIDFSVTRIVILALLAGVYLKSSRPFKWIWLDKMVIIFFACQLIAGITTTEMVGLAENRAGAAFDFVLPYFAVRLIINSYDKYLTLLRALVVVALPLAIVGFYQCLTGHNPVGFLKQYNAWKDIQNVAPIPRNGFFRADVTFPMSIMYGLYFSILGPLVVGLYGHNQKFKTIAVIGLILYGMGTFASMSSGPMLGLLVAGLFGLFFKYRNYWKHLVIVIILSCLVVEIISNRHFYDALGRLTLNPATAWYRSRLIDVALFEGGMSGYWITGHGFADPGWSLVIDNRDHTDIVNQYLLLLSVFGLVGLIPFIMIIVLAFKNVARAFRIAITRDQKWVIWCLAASIIGSSLAIFTVSLFGQPFTAFFITLALCGSSVEIMNSATAGMMYQYREAEKQSSRHSGSVLMKPL